LPLGPRLMVQPRPSYLTLACSDTCKTHCLSIMSTTRTRPANLPCSGRFAGLSLTMTSGTFLTHAHASGSEPGTEQSRTTHQEARVPTRSEARIAEVKNGGSQPSGQAERGNSFCGNISHKGTESAGTPITVKANPTAARVPWPRRKTPRQINNHTWSTIVTANDGAQSAATSITSSCRKIL
jgi:hypothetical protein